MIQVTLTFHSIAAAIAALSLLPADTAISGVPSVAPGNDQPAPSPTTPPAVVKEAKKVIETAKAGPAAAAAPASSPKPDAGQETASADPLDYEKDVKPLALKVAAKGREVLMKAWADLGVANGKELKPEQYAGAVAHFEQLLAA